MSLSIHNVHSVVTSCIDSTNPLDGVISKRCPVGHNNFCAVIKILSFSFKIIKTKRISSICDWIFIKTDFYDAELNTNKESGAYFYCTANCTNGYSASTGITTTCCTTDNCNTWTSVPKVTSCYTGGTLERIRNMPIAKQTCMSPYNKYCVVICF